MLWLRQKTGAWCRRATSTATCKRRQRWFKRFRRGEAGLRGHRSLEVCIRCGKVPARLSYWFCRIGTSPLQTAVYINTLEGCREGAKCQQKGILYFWWVCARPVHFGIIGFQEVCTCCSLGKLTLSLIVFLVLLFSRFVHSCYGCVLLLDGIALYLAQVSLQAAGQQDSLWPSFGMHSSRLFVCAYSDGKVQLACVS